MKVLWIVNMVLPALANHLNIQTSSSGTWMEDLSNKISKSEDVELAVACVYGKKFEKYVVDNITYYLLPGNGKTMLFYSKKLEKYWEMVENDFSPDMVHVHGSEYSHSISYLRKYPEKKCLLTIQGAINKIAPKNDGELGFFKCLVNRTARENVRFNGLIENKLLMKHNCKHEREIVRRARYATGRTYWDRSFMLEVNPDIKYFRVFYNLRDVFYGADLWDIEKAEPHTIFASTAASNSVKGGHIFVKALSIIKRSYPDVKAIFIAPATPDGKMVVKNGYMKYVAKLIKKYGLEDNVECFTRLSATEMMDKMRQSRCCVIPSAMENASATLREAMHLGAPSIASFRGGMVNVIQDGHSGFFYDYTEYGVLAQRVMQLFEDDELCLKFSENAKASIASWHDREKNVSDMLDVYRTIMKDG